MSTDVVNVKEIKSAAGPRKANECLAEAKRFKRPAELFDEFWREGELALFFGASGIGKSVLAMQIADALARGTPLHGFVMPKGRRKVLYVDLSLSVPQFHARYGLYKFAENLYRDAPPDGAELCDWIKSTVEENGFRVVIVDDLAAIKRTHDGIRETLGCMRRLKRLSDKLGISILVLSDAFEPPDQWVSENDLKRSRVLCTVADSVFAIGRKRRPEGGCCIVQTRSRSAEVFWNMQNAPVGEIKRLVSGILGFEFDERFTPEMDEDKRRLICEISRLHEVDGKTFREIGETLGISKSWACELYKKWTPALDRGLRNADCGLKADESDDDDEYYDDEYDDLSEPGAVATGELSVHSVVEEEIGTTEHTEEDTELSTLNPPLSTRLDGYGREIFVESEDANGKPMIWYQNDGKGNKVRHERGPFGVNVQHLNSGPYL